MTGAGSERLVGDRVRDGVAYAELESPPANACSHAMMRPLDEAFLDLEKRTPGSRGR